MTVAELARAERAGKAEQLRTLPKLRSAARQVASAMEVVMGTQRATEVSGRAPWS